MEGRRHHAASVQRERVEEAQALIFKKARVWSHLDWSANSLGNALIWMRAVIKEDAPFSAVPVPNPGPPNPDWDVAAADEEVARDHFGSGAED